AGVLLVAAAEILAPEVEEARLALDEAILVEPLLALGEELLVTGDVAGVDEGGLVLLVGLRLIDAFRDRAAGLADLEADVPEQVEDFLDEGGDLLRQLVRRAGEEEEQVDVGGGVQGPAAVAAGGHERQAGG